MNSGRRERKIEKLSERLLKANIRLPGRKNSLPEVIHYDDLYLDYGRLFLFLLKTAALLSVLSWAFFDSLLPAVIFFFPAALIAGKKEAGKRIAIRKTKLKKEFLTEITLLGDYLRTGYSVENAVRASEKELTGLYGPDSDMVREIRLMNNGFSLNRTAEELFLEFAGRTGVPEINEFASVFSLVNRSGGQVREIIQEVGRTLSMEFAADDEIRTMLVSRKLEQKIMDAMPLAILCYVKAASPDFLSIMYETLTGRLVMAVCLGVYGAAYLWSEKILDIKVG